MQLVSRGAFLARRQSNGKASNHLCKAMWLRSMTVFMVTVGIPFRHNDRRLSASSRRRGQLRRNAGISGRLARECPLGICGPLRRRGNEGQRKRPRRHLYLDDENFTIS
jgi:hypothetical protein